MLLRVLLFDRNSCYMPWLEYTLVLIYILLSSFTAASYAHDLQHHQCQYQHQPAFAYDSENPPTPTPELVAARAWPVPIPIPHVPLKLRLKRQYQHRHRHRHQPRRLNPDSEPCVPASAPGSPLAGPKRQRGPYPMLLELVFSDFQSAYVVERQRRCRRRFKHMSRQRIKTVFSQPCRERNSWAYEGPLSHALLREWAGCGHGRRSRSLSRSRLSTAAPPGEPGYDLCFSF
ncbi:hypothetical protein GALMADRAFT_159332 [Galerina marginata CBS 339.88]|uniref:Uncharacterized protein n=1 Tax=Galerina marginata (strain CBS 339.88) TaxID=685588 RepID=A0A067SKT2_GALM3|nr:hypothetical protein GALMADRAFT_159332 [Galerina marginata CBS 339.88]